MATALNSTSKRRYSWWWDSHISPKNSKWLQENLTDMDSKVKAMIRLIEEDADSFARRAEMYYKKRPELMKLVEEFYRAYRALAERYNHATGELRQAHKTIAAAFPNEYVLADDSVSGTSETESEPRTPEIPHQLRAWLDADDTLGLSSANLHTLKKNGGNSEDSGSGISKRGLKQLNEMFGSGGVTFLKPGPMDSNHTEADLENLRKALEEIRAEKEAVLNQHQQNLEKLTNLERELSQAKTDAGGLGERARKAEIEIQVLKEALSKLRDEKDAIFLQYNNCLETISNLEATISQAQVDEKRLDERALYAETEADNLKKKLSRLEEEKESVLNQYKQCLEIISALQNKISLAEENARLLNKQTSRAESEVETLKRAVSKLTEEKEAARRQYEDCLEIISKMECEISLAQEDAKRLNNEILLGNEKIKSIEEQCTQFETSNEFLQIEAENLAREIAEKDLELSDKKNELEKLQNSLQDEHSRFLEVEGTLHTLQNLHNQTQEEQRALTLELEDKFQMLKNLEIRNNELEEDNQHIKEENLSLNQWNTESNISKQKLENEILSLKQMKEKLEEQVTIQVTQSNVLQQEVYQLREEIKDMNMRYQSLLEKVQSVGLNPECLESSVKELQDENSKLQEACKDHCTERGTLSEKLKDMENLMGKTAALEKSLSEVNGKLEGSRERIKDLQDANQYHQGEKSALVTEKATLLSQLSVMTQNMQNLLEKNSSLENSLQGANVELESLRVKSRSLEEFCQLLKNEKSNILEERNFLVSRLQIVEQRLGNLELRFTKLEEKYADLEKEKDFTLVQVEELQKYLSVQQKERAGYEQSSQFRMADLENDIHELQEENRSAKKEFDEELEKSVNAQVEVFVLQKFIKDLEEKNKSLLMECQKHVEASKLSDKLIVELESENLEQQMEGEFLLDEIEKLRLGIYKVLKALHFDPVIGRQDNKIGHEETPLPRIINSIEDLKSSFLSNIDEKNQLVIENSVLLTLVREFEVDGAEILTGLQNITNELKAKNETLGVKLENKEAENLHLNEVVEQLSGELREARVFNHQLTCEIVTEKEMTCQKEKEVSEAERKLTATCILNAELFRAIEELNMECRESKQTRERIEKEIIKISENSNEQKFEIECLHQVNEDLKKEMEKQMVREENLCLELQERENEFELWESEAASFYFDFQASTVREIFLENKVQELTTICENLEGDCVLKNETIEEMKDRVGVLESKVGELTAQLSGYVPVIASLKESIISLEHNSVLRKQMGDEMAAGQLHVMSCKSHGDINVSDMMSELLQMKARINAVEKAMVKETDRLAVRRSLNSIVKPKVLLEEAEERKLRSTSHHGKEIQEENFITDNLKLLKTRPEVSEARNGMMKDIPLDQVSDFSFYGTSRRKSGDDQMLGLWESAEQGYNRGQKIDGKHRSRNPSSDSQIERDLSVDKVEISTNIREQSEERKKLLVLQRLHSDGHKLTSLQTSVADMKKKADLNKRRKKTNGVEYKEVEQQLGELEDAVLQLIEINERLTKDANPSLTTVKKTSAELKESTRNHDQVDTVLEQAWKGSEKIGRLQFELQTIQYVLLKLEDENKAKVKSKFPGGIVLRDFVVGRRSTRRRKKSRFCGCVRSSANSDSG
ncbi:hypothetical protein ACFE04_005758 [Oxalis oulophora]